MIGSTLSHYRILERLGGGGMGVVYKAQDLKLGRLVALKFLAGQRGAPEEEKRRFLREAQAASQLDHPNVCTIYEIGETGEGELFIAMALYEGETLRQRLKRGPLPIEQAVDIALQVAAGLSQAHERGIIHRDVKPANIFLAHAALTADGTVKLLDFGIARLAGQSRLTRAGRAMGTASYVAPEQLRGQSAGPFSDVWGLGVVIYEMVTGHRPFGNSSGNSGEVLRAILGSEPEPMSRHRSGVPPKLEEIVVRALSKQPAGRYASMKSLRADLLLLAKPSNLAEDTEDTEQTLLELPVPASAPLPTAPPETTESLRGRTIGPYRVSELRGFRLWKWAALAGAVALAGLLGYLLRTARAPAPEPVHASFAPMTDQPGVESFPSLAPDGEYFAYSRESAPGNEDVFFQRTGGSNAINLTADSPASDTQPAFSPDGRTIAFRSERDGGGIFLMGATGESVRRLTSFGFNPSWSPDGSEILCGTEPAIDPKGKGKPGRIWRVDVATGRRRLVETGDAMQPSWSPGGRRIAYWGVPPGSSRRVLWTVPAEGGRPAEVSDGASLNWSPVWSPDGHYLYYASNRSGSMNLWRVPIDEKTGRLLGPTEPVTTPSLWSGPLSLAQDGRRILYATRNERYALERTELDPATLAAAGPAEPVVQGSLQLAFADISPDGWWVAFTTLLPQEDLFVVRPDGSRLRQLTRDVFKDRGVGWSPDGRILFFSDRSGRFEAWTIRPDGSGLEALTRSTGDAVFFPRWSPDGRWLVCGDGFKGPALIDLSLSPSGRKPQRLPPPPAAGFFVNAWSPEGRRLAGAAAGQGIFSFSLDTRRYERLAATGEQPQWLRDSHRLLYLDRGEVRMLDLRTRESHRVLTPPQGSSFQGFDVTPEGRFLYTVRTNIEGDLWMLSVQGGGD